MSSIPGSVTLTGFIAPSDTADTYAVLDPKYGVGGYREVASLTERDAITTARRRIGMMTFVQSEGNIYQLVDGTNNANWALYNGMSGSVNGTLESPTNKTYVLDLASPSSYTINTATLVTASGTCTVSYTIDNVNITGLSSLAVTSTPQTVSAAALNVVQTGQTLRMVVSSVSSVVDLQFSLAVLKAANVDSIGSMVEVPTNKTYIMDLSATYSYTMDYLSIQTAGGTCTAAIQINGTNVGSLSGISVTSSYQKINATSANVVSIGNKVTLVITNVSIAVDLQVSIAIH
jgi:hypothetical protein